MSKSEQAMNDMENEVWLYKYHLSVRILYINNMITHREYETIKKRLARFAKANGIEYVWNE